MVTIGLKLIYEILTIRNVNQKHASNKYTHTHTHNILEKIERTIVSRKNV